MARLSFEDKSFLSFKIGNTIYTNNDSPPAGTQPLPYGISAMLGDTITTVWQLTTAKLTQRVYPSGGIDSRMIVRFTAENTSSKPLTIGTQYLLDVQIAGQDGVDFFIPHRGVEKTLTVIKDSMPSHIGFVENEVPNAPTFRTGLVAEVQFKHPSVLTKLPSLLILNHWPEMERVVYASESYKQKSIEIFDAALLMQWDSISIAPGAIAETGSFIYGANEIETCKSVLFAYLFMPRVMQKNEPAVDIPIYVGNYKSNRLTNIFVTLNATGALMFADGTRQSQRLIDTLQMYGSTGLVASMLVDPTSNEDQGTLTISATTTQNPELHKSCPISIPVGRTNDTHPPEIVNITRKGLSGDCTTMVDTLVIRDDSDLLDTGIESVTFIDSTNYRVRFKSSLSSLPDYRTYEFTVIDTLMDARALIWAEDAQQLVAIETLMYCTTPDLLAPRMNFRFNGRDRFAIDLLENRAWDRRLDSVRITNAVNIIVTQNEVRGSETVSITVRSADGSLPSSFCIGVSDLAGNSSSDTCLNFVTASVPMNEAAANIRIYPNPAKDVISVDLDHTVSQPAAIHDLSGKLVWSGLLPIGGSSIDTSLLPSGAYTLVLTNVGEPYIIPFRIER